MDDPRYGSELPGSMPVLAFDGVVARVLAGSCGGLGADGPFKTVQPVQIIDFVLSPDAEFDHVLTDGLDNCIVYAYSGAGFIGQEARPIAMHYAARMDAQLSTSDQQNSTNENRVIKLKAGGDGMSVIVFGGKRLNQPVAWHGPFVMTTDAEIQRTISDYQRGTFLKKRAAWDFKRISTKPTTKL